MAFTFQEFRLKKGISLDLVAKKAGIDVDLLIGYESDSKTMPCSVAVKLCRIYGISSFELVKIS